MWSAHWRSGSGMRPEKQTLSGASASSESDAATGPVPSLHSHPHGPPTPLHLLGWRSGKEQLLLARQRAGPEQPAYQLSRTTPLRRRQPPPTTPSGYLSDSHLSDSLLLRYSPTRRLLRHSDDDLDHDSRDINGNLIMKFRRGTLMPSEARAQNASRSLSLDRNGDIPAPPLPRVPIGASATLDRRPKNKGGTSMLRSFAEQMSVLEELTRAWDTAVGKRERKTSPSPAPKPLSILPLKPSRVITHLSPFVRNAGTSASYTSSRMVRFASKDDVLSFASGGSGGASPRSPPLAKPEIDDDHQTANSAGKSSEAVSTPPPPDKGPVENEAVTRPIIVNKSPTTESPGVVFLQQGEETKRAAVKAGGFRTLDDILNLFARTFPTSLHYSVIRNPNTKIYIQDRHKSDIFYELDDVREVRDRCVLRLRDQSGSGPRLGAEGGGKGPTDEELNYFSEPELAEAAGPRRGLPYRPSSTLPVSTASSPWTLPPPKPSYSAYAPHRPSPSSPFHPASRLGVFRSASDTEGLVTGDRESDRSSITSSIRSGSVTPVIDEEARARVVEMENQLSSLSSLVHSALMSKGTNDSVFKDLELLRREILGSGLGSGGRDVDMGSEAGSVSTRFSDISSTFAHIPVEEKVVVGEPVGEGRGDVRERVAAVRSRVGDLRSECTNIRRLALHNAETREFERSVEELRRMVVSGERRLKLAEVEDFTHTLTTIGRSTANLKGDFPQLQNRLKRLMSAEMERVVREEKFLKEQPYRLDNALRRCKKLTKTMLTMKKLALVQDPHGGKSPMGPNFNSAGPPIPPPPTDYAPAPPKPALKATTPVNSTTPEREKTPTTLDAKRSESHHVLDSLLEELQTVGSRPGGLNTLPRNSDNTKLRLNGGLEHMEGGLFSSSLSLPRGGHQDRSRSGTPNSVASEPAFRRPPPPPPRSSSRNSTRALLLQSPSPPTDPRRPGPLVHTDALSADELATSNSNSQRLSNGGHTKGLRSASSSESINSQESLQQAPSKPPPPPPPPRNRAEHQQQRQEELLARHRPQPSYPAGLRASS